MQGHREKLPDPITNESLATLAADKSQPMEVRKSAQYMIKHGMVERLGNQDGDISGKDWENIGNIPGLAEFNRKKTKTYTENYIPSDAPAGDRLPRPITANDAARELYLYSDSLPDDIGPEELQAIADGKCDKKCPPQVRAAAQFMVDHPREWKKIADDGGQVGRGELQDDTSGLLHLREDEMGTIKTVQKNKDLFLRDGGEMSRDSLTALAADKSVPPEVRKAAQALLDNPLVFGMIDNAKNSHNNSDVNVNDGVANEGDIDALATRLTTANRTPPGKPVGQHTPTDAVSRAAMVDMIAGTENDPEIKEVVHKKKSPFAKILDIAGKVLDGVKMAVDAVAGFLPPPANVIGIAIGAAIGTVNDLAIKPAAAMLNGASPKEAYKQAAIDFALDMAGSAISLIPGGGVAKAAMAGGRIAMTTAKAGAKEAVEAGVKAGAKEGVEATTHVVARESVKAGMKEGAKGGAKEGTEQGSRAGAREGSERGAQEGAEAAAKPTRREKAKDFAREARDTAVDEAKGQAEDQAISAAEERWNRLQQSRAAAQGGAATGGTSTSGGGDGSGSSTGGVDFESRPMATIEEGDEEEEDPRATRQQRQPSSIPTPSEQTTV